MENQATISTSLHLPPPENASIILSLAALLSVLPKRGGQECHSLLARGSQEPLGDFSGVRKWLETELQERLSPSLARRAGRQLDQWSLEGFWVAHFPSSPYLPGQGQWCPQVLFGQGRHPQEAFHVAFFNSRKPRTLSPRALWLQAMRAFMGKTVEASRSLLSSLGTLTHDMVSHVGSSQSIPMTLVVHDPFHRFALLHERYGFSSGLKAQAVMTCQAPGMACPREKLMVCRDRILAHLADAHLLLELRAGGNLFRVLRDLHARAPRPLWFFAEEEESEAAASHAKTARSINPKAQPLFLEATEKNVQVPPGSGTGPFRCKRTKQEATVHSPPMDWSHYLYHYTRSCWGPWPGQTYEDHLEALYRGRRDAGHTVLDTLARILSEGRLRAGSKIIRGSTPVISWTSLAPARAHEMRRWNKALLRWTLEPYGIAVLVNRLKKLGAKPSVYGPESIFQRMKESERYRFQRHEPPHVCWRHEREYRLQGDLHLAKLETEEYFVFVPRECDAERLWQLAPHAGTVVIAPTMELQP